MPSPTIETLIKHTDSSGFRNTDRGLYQRKEIINLKEGMYKMECEFIRKNVDSYDEKFDVDSFVDRIWEKIKGSVRDEDECPVINGGIVYDSRWEQQQIAFLLGRGCEDFLSRERFIWDQIDTITYALCLSEIRIIIGLYSLLPNIL